MYQRVAKVKPAAAAGEGRHFNLRPGASPSSEPPACAPTICPGVHAIRVAIGGSSGVVWPAHGCGGGSRSGSPPADATTPHGVG